MLLGCDRSIFGGSDFAENDVMAIARTVSHEHSHGADSNDPIARSATLCSLVFLLFNRRAGHKFTFMIAIYSVLLWNGPKLKSDFNFRKRQDNTGHDVIGK